MRRQTLTFVVHEKLFEVGIDPYDKLIDQVSADNRMRVNFESAR